ncbi:MAG: AIM24 family protein [Propionibacteriales bacterium]|nr:AIM24 family protein [Propionibacteriales bacterium]
MRSELFAQEHHETTTTERFTLQNPWLLKVVLGPDVLAAKGAMVAYQGQASFTHEGSGSLGKFMKRAMTSEDTPLMRVSGQGEVFFADSAYNVFVMRLENDAISINGRSLLAFDAHLHWDVHRTKGAGIMTGGLFNTLIQGEGHVAMTAHGKPMILDCSVQPTYVDTQAAVCWSANLTPNIVSSMKMRSMLRGGSGEALQYAFHGPGFVVVQPSEGPPMPDESEDSEGRLSSLFDG